MKKILFLVLFSVFSSVSLASEPVRFLAVQVPGCPIHLEVLERTSRFLNLGPDLGYAYEVKNLSETGATFLSVIAIVVASEGWVRGGKMQGKAVTLEPGETLYVEQFPPGSLQALPGDTVILRVQSVVTKESAWSAPKITGEAIVALAKSEGGRLTDR